MTELAVPATRQRRVTRLALRDGRIVHVRPLERGDRGALAAAIAGLSERTRYLRFAATKPYLTEQELDVLTDVDHHRHEALVAVDPRSGRGIAVVRYVQVPDKPGAVEIAATVADEWQGRGLGTALVVQLAQRAREEGHSTLRAAVLAENIRSIRMLRRAGFRARSGSGTLREFELALHEQPVD
jgi:acetyltransferase